MKKTINDWTGYLESIKDNSSNTIRSYELDVINFLQFIKYRTSTKDIPISDIDQLDINDMSIDILNDIGVREIISYISYTDIHLNNSPSTRHRKLSSLRNFYNYLHKVINIIDGNPMLLVEGPKLNLKLPEYMNLEDTKILLETIQENEDSYFRKRDFAIVMTFLNTGIRLSELVGLKLDDLDGDTVNIIGKGNKERIIYLNRSVLSALEEYLEVRPNSECEHVFLNKSGSNFLGPRGIQYMLDKYVKQGGLSSKISPHTLRHTAATLLFQHGNVDIRTLQVILGHSSVSTTQIYTHVDTEKLKVAIDKNPLSDFEL